MLLFYTIYPFLTTPRIVRKFAKIHFFLDISDIRLYNKSEVMICFTRKC